MIEVSVFEAIFWLTVIGLVSLGLGYAARIKQEQANELDRLKGS